MSSLPRSAQDIYRDALEKATPAERTAYLEEACAGDVVLRQQVEALLHDERVRQQAEDASFALERRVDDLCLAFKRAGRPVSSPASKTTWLLHPSRNSPCCSENCWHWSWRTGVGMGRSWPWRTIGNGSRNTPS